MQGERMEGSAVALVPMELIGGIDVVVEAHEPIAYDFGHDGGTTDRIAAPVSTHNGPARHRDGRRRLAVYEEQLRLARQILYRLLHGQEGRVEDIEAIDLIGTDNADADVRGGEDVVKRP